MCIDVTYHYTALGPLALLGEQLTALCARVKITTVTHPNDLVSPPLIAHTGTHDTARHHCMIHLMKLGPVHFWVSHVTFACLNPGGHCCRPSGNRAQFVAWCLSAMRSCLMSLNASSIEHVHSRRSYAVPAKRISIFMHLYGPLMVLPLGLLI
jgi:hypothetical protein